MQCPAPAMNALPELIRALDAATARGDRCALATLVAVEGSAYRRRGARMLVAGDGSCTGSISPGCLESDVAERARSVMHTGVPVILEYETASTGAELAWGLGLGCGGTIRILVEPLAPDSAYAATLRLAVDDECNPHGLRLTTKYAEAFVSHEATLLSPDDAAASAACETSPGMLVETLHSPVPLVVFGAGPDAVPLVELAVRLGWRVDVVDPQARPASLHRFPPAARVALARPDVIGGQLTITPRTMTMLMSHDYAYDVALLGFLLASPARYIGVMGPAARTQRMLAELAVTQPSQLFSETSLARLHAPAGLDIGADGAMEVALSIVAELRAVIGGREGGMLRDRRGGIHGDRAGECLSNASAR